MGDARWRAVTTGGGTPRGAKGRPKRVARKFRSGTGARGRAQSHGALGGWSPTPPRKGRGARLGGGEPGGEDHHVGGFEFSRPRTRAAIVAPGQPGGHRGGEQGGIVQGGLETPRDATPRSLRDFFDKNRSNGRGSVAIDLESWGSGVPKVLSAARHLDLAGWPRTARPLARTRPRSSSIK